MVREVAAVITMVVGMPVMVVVPVGPIVGEGRPPESQGERGETPPCTKMLSRCVVVYRENERIRQLVTGATRVQTLFITVVAAPQIL